MQNHHHPVKELSNIHVSRRPGFITQGLLRAGQKIHRCALGRSGIGIKRGEGDGITPIGRFGIEGALVRPDKHMPRHLRLPARTIEPHLGWCDAVGDRNYNQLVPLPYPVSHENLWRDDHLYDVALIMDFNRSRRLSLGGSAIFFHLAHDDYRPTEGCVAVSRPDMLALLPRIGPETKIVIS